MSTAAVSTDNLAVTVTNEVIRVYAKADSEGKIITKENKVVRAGKDGKTWAELDADTTYTNYFQDITVRRYKANSIEGARQLVPDEEEFVNLFNAGLRAKGDRQVTAVVTKITDDESNFTFENNGVLDTLDLIQEPTQRKNLTPVEKAIRSFRDALKLLHPTLSDEQLELQVRNTLSAAQDAGQLVEQSV